MKTYGTNGIQFRGYTLDVTPDSGYVVTGWKDDGYQYDGWILKTDKYGTVEWEKVLGGQYDDFINAACITPDGNIVVVLNDQFQDVGYKISQMQVIKYSMAGSVIWNKQFYYNRSITCKSIVALDDNSLALTGYNYVIDTILQKYAEPSYIFKLNPQGDSVWFRHFIYHSSNPNVLDYLNKSTAIDMIKTSDGGFLVCGDYIQYPPNVVPQSSWLVKLDSLGCDTPGCQFIGLPKGYVPDMTMLAYPNPTTRTTAIWSESFALGGTVVYTLHDATGKLVHSGKERLNGYSFELDLSNMPPGMYHLSVQQNGKAPVKCRIVKR